MDIVKKWFANILHYEDLSLGGARTLSDIEKEYDRLKLQSQQQSVRIAELETLLDSVITEVPRTITPELREKIDVALNKNKTEA